MAYPKKTSQQAIRTAAIDLLEREGEGALTIRRVASELALTPNAIYGHFASREILIAAVADEVAKRLLADINDALNHLNVETASHDKRLQTLVQVYLRFARNHPALYRTLMTDMSSALAYLPEPLGHDQLWLKVVEILMPLSGSDKAASAAVVLWSFVHGMLTLESARLLRGNKPDDVSEFGLDALVTGLHRINAH